MFLGPHSIPTLPPASPARTAHSVARYTSGNVCTVSIRNRLFVYGFIVLGCAIKHDLLLVSSVGNSAADTDRITISCKHLSQLHGVSIVAVDIYNSPSAITSTNQLPCCRLYLIYHL